MKSTPASRRLFALLLPVAISIIVGFSTTRAQIMGDFPSGQLSVILAEGAQIEDVNSDWGTVTLASFPQDRLYLLFHPSSDDLERLGKLMTEDPRIDMAEPNWYIESPEGVRQMVIGAVGGTFEDFEDQQMAARIGLDAAHEIGLGEDVIVAVLDTGLDPEHDLFAGHLLPGFDFIDMDDAPWEEADGLDNDGDGEFDEGYGHGTMVAGLVLLVAPEARILPIRVLDDEGCGDVFRVAAGIQYALAAGAQVIHMSFGVGSSIPETLGLLLEQDLPGDVIAVAGAGNENEEEPPYYPAAFDPVFMVTALDTLDVKADFADYNEAVLVSAPGVGIRSAYPGNDWGLGAGCSFAAPLVSGEAALLLALDPAIGREEMQAKVASGVDPIYDIPGNAAYIGKLGSGRIFLPAALDPESTGAPGGFAAAQLRVWPNPAAGRVRFSSFREQAGELEIFDISGRLLRRLLLGEGGYGEWDGRDEAGRNLPAGLYLARLREGGSPALRFVWMK